MFKKQLFFVLLTILSLASHHIYSQRYYDDVPETAKTLVNKENFSKKKYSEWATERSTGKYSNKHFVIDSNHEEKVSDILWFDSLNKLENDFEYHVKLKFDAVNRHHHVRVLFFTKKHIMSFAFDGLGQYTTKKIYDPGTVDNTSAIIDNEYNDICIRKINKKLYFFANKKLVKSDKTFEGVSSFFGVLSSQTKVYIKEASIYTVDSSKVINSQEDYFVTTSLLQKVKQPINDGKSKLENHKIEYKQYESIPESDKILLFEETFDDNTNDWTSIKKEGIEKEITDGQYTIASSKVAIESKNLYDLKYEFDYEVEADVMNIGTNPKNKFGIYTSQKKNDFISFISINGEGNDLYTGQMRSYLGKVSQRELKVWPIVYINKPNKLTIRFIRGKGYYYFINGQYLSAYSEHSYKNSLKGIGIFNLGGADSKMSIDNIKVYQLDLENLDVTYNNQINSTGLESPKPEKQERKLVKKETEQLDENTVGEYYALIICIDQYEDKSITPLEYSLDNGKQFSSILKSKYGFKENNITVLDNPSRSKILSQLNTLKSTLQPNDNLIIYYSGHGKYDKSLEESYWLPSDAYKEDDSNWISTSNLFIKIKGIKAKHTLLISDATFSGSIFQKSRDAFKDGSKAINHYASLRSKKCMTSNVEKPNSKESVFANELFKKLKTNSEKYITAGSLFYSINTTVSNKANVTPEYGVLKDTGDEGGEFIFINHQEQ